MCFGYAIQRQLFAILAAASRGRASVKKYFVAGSVNSTAVAASVTV